MLKLVDAGDALSACSRARAPKPLGGAQSPSRNLRSTRTVQNHASRDVFPRRRPGPCSASFVAQPYRHQHIASALLEGAVAYAREQGAEVVEGYPFDTAGITSTHRGHSRMFQGN